METPFVCVQRTEYLWQRMYDTLAQASIVSFISQCIIWMSIFYAFHRFKLFCQGRQRNGRLKKVLEDHRMQSHNEWEDNIERLCREAQTAGGTGYGVLGGAAEESLPMVPVSICVDDDNSYGDADSIAGSRLKHAASQLSASRQEVTVLQACAGPVVQTKLTRLLPQILADATASTAKKSSSKSEAGSEAVVKERTRFLLQLGGSRIFRPSVGKHAALDPKREISCVSFTRQNYCQNNEYAVLVFCYQYISFLSPRFFTHSTSLFSSRLLLLYRL